MHPVLRNWSSAILVSLLACEASATQFIDHADRDHAQVNIQADGKNRSVNKERRITNGVSRSERRSESQSFTIHRDLMADPYLFAKVAARNGMTPMRLANQAEDRIIQMVIDYVREEGLVEQHMKMPQQAFAGDQLPVTKGDLSKQAAANHSDGLRKHRQCPQERDRSNRPGRCRRARH